MISDNFSKSLIRSADEIERLRAENRKLSSATRRFVDAYADANPMRQADWHTEDCNCLRCAFDNARAALAEQGEK